MKRRVGSKGRLTFLPLLLLFLAVYMPLCSGASMSWRTHELTNVDVREKELKELVEMINLDNVAAHINVLASYESRVTGYEGCEKAAEYIASVLRSYNVSVTIQEYNVLVPIDKGSGIVIHYNGSSVSIPAYALWPNYIVTSYIPPEKPVRGRLIYVGKGELKDFNGKDIEGSVILMDFNSGSNWKNAMKLGARAVIFLEPDETSYSEAFSKLLLLPVHFPRVYVQRQYASILRDAAAKGLEAEVFLNMKWEEVKAKNVIGIVTGSENPNDIIIVAAHYDTWSIVPRLAPGADEASSVAGLLELARLFSERRPKYSVWFVALSGHWLALSGAREFVEKYFFDEKVLNGELKLWTFIALDFSTGGTKIDLLYAGYFYGYTGGAITAIETRWTRWLEPKILNDILPCLVKATGRDYDVASGFLGMYGWWGRIYGPYMLDSEPFAIAHGLGFALRTVDLREHWGHPLSRKVTLLNLKPQLEVALAIIYTLAYEGVNMKWDLVSPARALYVAGGAEVAGYITIYGKVLMFNYSKGWYDPVPESIVVIMRGGPQFDMYPFNDIIVKSDEKGEFVVHGIGGLFAVSHAGWGGAQIYVEAYKFDDKTGLITFAPDFGQFGSMQLPFYYQPDRHPFNVSTVVFECSSIVLFDLVDPINLAPKMFMDPRFKNLHYAAWYSMPSMIQVLDFKSLGPYLNWGYSYLPFEDIAVVFVPPDTRAAIMYKLTTAYRSVGVLVNSSGNNPEGEGIKVGEREQLIIPFTVLRFAEEMYLLGSSRYHKLRSKLVISPTVEQHLSDCEKWLSLAREAFAGKDFESAYMFARLAWVKAFYAYEEVMRLIYDTVSVNTVFLIAVVPFTVLFEALTISASGRRKIVSLVSVTIAAVVFFYFIHPAPQIAAVYWMSPLTVAILLLLIFVTWLFLGRISEIANKYRERVAGKHFVEVSRTDLTMTLFNASVQFMKKRKLRSILTMVIVVTVIYSLVSLTSTIPVVTVTLTQPTIYSPSYKGILVTKLSAAGGAAAPSIWATTLVYGATVPVFDHVTPELLYILTGLNFSVRVWWYPQSVRSKSVYATIVGRNGSYNIKAMLGLSHNEVLKLQEALVNGSWLPKHADYVCIIPENIAKSLGVSVGDQISLPDYDMNFTVIGIINPRVANIMRDLDGGSIVPPNPDAIAGLLRGFVQEQQWIPLSYEEIIIVPYHILLDRGGFIASIAAPAEDFDKLKELVGRLTIYFELINIYISDGTNVLMGSPYVAFGFFGWNILVVPLLISALMLANVILGNVRERSREIAIFSALGLAPREVGLVFVVEALVYALVGFVIGYLLGIVSNVMLFEYKILPPNFVVNVSSLSTVVILVVGLIALLAPSVYPAIVVSRLVVPSLERKWRISTKPREDEWEIPLPYAARSESEVLGFLEFLREYFEFHRKESVEVFITDNVTLDKANMKLEVTCHLQPLESGVVQKVLFRAEYLKGEGRYAFSVLLKLLEGRRDVWLARVPVFIDAVRKQMLVWRGLSQAERARYFERAAPTSG